MTLKDTALRGICWVRQKREEKKRIWKLTEGLGSETLQQNMRCISSFLVLHWKKSNIVWEGISGNKLPPSAWNSKKDIERQKKGQSNLQMLLSKPSLKILWLSKALIKKKKTSYHWCNLSTSPTNLALHKTQQRVWNAAVSKTPRQCFQSCPNCSFHAYFNS